MKGRHPSHFNHPTGGDPFVGDVSVPAPYAAFAGDVDDTGDLYSTMIEPFIADLEEGDMDDGDVFDANEIGDLSEEGSIIGKALKKRKVKRLTKRIARLNKKKSKATGMLKAERAAAGKYSFGDSIPFLCVAGGKVESIDAFPYEANFEATKLTSILERCSYETPGAGIIVSTSTPGTEFGTTTGASVYYYYPFAVIKLGVSALNGIANQLVTLVYKLPYLNGTRTTTTVGLQLMNGSDATIIVFPYQLVQGKPVITLGRIGLASDTTDEVLITCTGLPSGAVASLFIPQSEHPLFRKWYAAGQL